jgi:LuxR family quorum-sensing system transcriptional regulator CciR
MSVLACLEDFVRQLLATDNIDDLGAALDCVTRLLGFEYFALTEHVNPRAHPSAIRLHSYPQGWVDRFEDAELGPVDPIHRASSMYGVAFAWDELPDRITLTARDRLILSAAADHGIFGGFTVPANVPGAISGSCSFAGLRSRPLPGTRILAQIAGLYAFEAARRLWHDPASMRDGKAMTDRERDCVIWVGRGKTDWEIAQILGISHETVIRHVKNARQRYEADKRTLLVVRALFDGSISFRDLLKR